MIKKAVLVGSLDTKPYKFPLRYYDISEISLFVNGKQVPSQGISLSMDHEKTSIMGYRTLFEGSDIHNSKSGLQITHDMYINATS